MKRIVAVILSLILCAMVFSGCGDSSRSTNYETKSSTSNHKCYVCGKTGNIKYGSYYYCSTHYAYVKTVVENS